MSEVKIQEVFGQFAVKINGKVEMFDTEQAASLALAIFENGAAFQERADAYGASTGLSEKAAKGKSNVVLAFLVWEDAGSPAYVAPVVVADDAEAVAEVAVEAVVADDEGDDLEF